jgi:adenylosuccinate synthase
VRRVGRFDADLVQQAIIANNPNIIVLNHVDYIDSQYLEQEMLNESCINFINNVQESIKRKIDFVGTGPYTMVELNRGKKCGI